MTITTNFTHRFATIVIADHGKEMSEDVESRIFVIYLLAEKRENIEILV